MSGPSFDVGADGIQIRQWFVTLDGFDERTNPASGGAHTTEIALLVPRSDTG